MHKKNCITTTKDIPVPYPIYNRGEWMNHQLTAEEKMMDRVKFYFKFMYLTPILCIWFKSKVISALERHCWKIPNIATVEIQQSMDKSEKKQVISKSSAGRWVVSAW